MEAKEMIISENDLRFLVSLGDSDQGFVARGEVAEMYGIVAEENDALVLSIIYGNGDKTIESLL